MNKYNLSLLGLDESATRQDIEEAYRTLSAKYKEDRFLDGEAGNAAARNLTKIETAYRELINELNEESVGDAGSASFEKVEELLRSGDIQEAQRVLDGFNERGAYWHYLQSVVFYRKNWINESKKQLEIAMRLEPDNEKYRTAYKKLNDKVNSDAANDPSRQQGAYRAQTMDTYQDDQMGGSFCSSCLQCLAINMCINCLCNSCCH